MPIGGTAVPTRGGRVGPKTFTWSTPGTYTFGIPRGITSLTVDVAGAQGGSKDGITTGGKGGRAQATVPVTGGSTLTVIVGGQNGSGGGTGGTAGSAGSGGQVGYPGGGSSELRKADGTRLVVAGAGGGSTGDGSGWDGGGTGAGQTVTPTAAGKQGTGSAAGAAGGSGGNAGSGANGGNGGNGVSGSTGNGGGGGGGGYFGGGGGGHAPGDGTNHAGGGGSGHVDPSCTSVTGTDGFRSGDGYITVSWI